MAQWDLNSQPTCMDGPYTGSLDRKFNDQVHVHCANGNQTLSRLLRRAWVYGGPILLYPRVPTEI